MSDSFTLLAHANGTFTLVDIENGQAMHSRIGPVAEAHLVYADLAKIEDRLVGVDHSVTLYDVGMGTASNVLATLENIRSRTTAQGKLRIFSFESKPEGLRVALATIRERSETFTNLAPWSEILSRLLSLDAAEIGRVELTIGQVQVEWTLLVGDFYTRMRETPPAEVIYFDFYSPKVVPTLWSLENFCKLREYLGRHATTLYTYSAATPTRLHLLAAGFFVGEGVSTGMKNETTIAATRLADLKNPLTERWLRKLEYSTSIADPIFSATKTLVRNHPQWARPK